MSNVLSYSPDNSSSKEKIILDEDQKERSITLCKKIIDASSFVHDFIKSGEITVSVRHNGIECIKHYIKDLGNILGSDDDVKQNQELTKKMLRDAYTEIERLKQEFGKNVSLEPIVSKLHQSDEIIRKWWNELGFSYCTSTVLPWRDSTFFNICFSFGIDGSISFFEEKPVTAKKKLKEKQRELGKKIELHEHDSDFVVLDNPNNRIWLKQRLSERFPTAEFFKWESYHIRGTDLSQLFHAEAKINLKEI